MRGGRANHLANHLFAVAPHLERSAAVLRGLSLFSSEIGNRTPYNPRSEKRRGDSMDLLLLTALSLPAYIITEESKLVERLSRLGIPEAERLLSINQFVDRANAGTLRQLD